MSVDSKVPTSLTISSSSNVGAGVVGMVGEVGDTEVSCWTDSWSGGSAQQDSESKVSMLQMPGSSSARSSSVKSSRAYWSASEFMLLSSRCCGSSWSLGEDKVLY